jgi:hypothetical protein
MRAKFRSLSGIIEWRVEGVVEGETLSAILLLYILNHGALSSLKPNRRPTPKS